MSKGLLTSAFKGNASLSDRDNIIYYIRVGGYYEI